MCVRFNLGQRLRLTFPSRLRVTRAAEAGGDGKGKGRKTLSLSLSLAFLLPITPLAPLRKYKERQLGTSQGLLRKRNLSPVSKFCQAAPVSLFWAYNELPEHFEFSFNLIGKSTMAFYQANHSAHSNPGALVGGPN